jgi:hypothetical protein
MLFGFYNLNCIWPSRNSYLIKGCLLTSSLHLIDRKKKPSLILAETIFSRYLLDFKFNIFRLAIGDVLLKKTCLKMSDIIYWLNNSFGPLIKIIRFWPPMFCRLCTFGPLGQFWPSQCRRGATCVIILVRGSKSQLLET